LVCASQATFGCVELLVFDGGEPAQGAVGSLPVVEDLQLLKDRVPRVNLREMLALLE